MTDKLPPNILKLFAPRPPISQAHHLDRHPGDRKGPQISGVSLFLDEFKEYAKEPYVRTKTAQELRQERIMQSIEKAAESKDRQLEEYTQFKANIDSGASNDQLTSDPFRTVFVCRIPDEATEEQVRELFGRFGTVSNVKMVSKPSGNFRHYAFVEYENERDAKAALREGDGLRMGRARLLVDVERGRTVKEWLPRRLGGGISRKSYSGYRRAEYSGQKRSRRNSPDDSTRSRSPKRRDDYYRR